MLRNGRGRNSERPAHRNEEWPPLAATGESPRTKRRPNTAKSKINKYKINDRFCESCFVFLKKKKKKIKPSTSKDVVRWALLYLEGGGVNCFLAKQLDNMKQSWTHSCLRSKGVPSFPSRSLLQAPVLSSPDILPQIHNSSHLEPLSFTEKIFSHLHILFLLPETFFFFPHQLPSPILFILQNLA